MMHSCFLLFSFYNAFTETRATQTMKNQSDGRTETLDSNIFKSSQSNVLFSNPANQMSYFQIQPIKFLVQNNEISTYSLWCLRDYHAAYINYFIVKLKLFVVSRACGFKNYMLYVLWGRWVVWKIDGNKSCVMLSVVNIYCQKSLWCRVLLRLFKRSLLNGLLAVSHERRFEM